ncbi:cytochrome P450 [Mycena belliarum]|uniref:Cytochrome P450 n=1 Tax=Mycena belliarum TaxID=1033014 RepID=A0AAD6U2A2_9AGAR|nr:cytochrome P450 [Mycena belliae]
MPNLAATVTDIAIVALALAVSGFLFCKRKRMPLPPGPKGYPLIGNLFDMPRSHSWTTFANWGEKYGGILSIKLLGQPFIILNDPEIAMELLERRGNIYADRPTFQMAHLCGWDRVLSSARYGPRFKEYRKLISKVIGTRGSMEKFYPMEDHQGNMLLKRVLEDPSAFESATRKTAAAMVLHLTYGYQIKEDTNDPFVDLADKAMAEFSEVMRPGAFLIDVLPILRYVPSWFPGANFKHIAERYGNSCDDLAEIPLAYVREQMASGHAPSSYVADLLTQPDVSEQKKFDIKWSAASFYSAGSDTTVSIVTAYFLAAAKFPHIQAKAQAEMDNVIGPSRLPTFDDRAALPYIDALCKELCRWLPIVPLAAPHRAMKDDVYGGYAIPKDAFVMPNIWKFFHDPTIYADPFVFDPDRFMGPKPEPDPADMGLFGYGRRVCPGIHLADVSIWISVAKAVAGLSISRALDEHGNAIDPVADVTDGIVSRPVPFRCDVKPRSERMLQLIREATA